MAGGDILKLKEIEKYSVNQYLEHLEYLIDKNTDSGGQQWLQERDNQVKK